MPCWAALPSLWVCSIWILSVTLFSPFLSRFSRGTQGEWGLLARPRGAFCGGAKKQQLRSIGLFLGGTANPEGPAIAGKQNPAVPPARRRLSHLAVPARGRGVRKGV